MPALLLVVALTALVAFGIKESLRVNLVLVGLKLFIVLFVIIAGLFYVSGANYHPFIPPAADPISSSGLTQPLFQWIFGIDQQTFGVLGVISAASVVFFAYIGFDVVATTAEEARNPQRDLPRGILVSLAICTVLYMAVALVITGMVPYDKIDPEAALATAFRDVGQDGFATMIAAGAVAGLTTVVMTLLIGAIRVLFAMSRDGLIPHAFGRTNPRTGTPLRITVTIGALVAVVAAYTPIGKLEEMVNIGTLTAFALVSIAVPVLRRTRPDLDRPFRVPLSPWLPGLSALVCVYLMLNLSIETWLRFVVWMAIGFLFYFVYGQRKSRVRARRRGEGGCLQCGRLGGHDGPACLDDDADDRRACSRTRRAGNHRAGCAATPAARLGSRAVVERTARRPRPSRSAYTSSSAPARLPSSSTRSARRSTLSGRPPAPTGSTPRRRRRASSERTPGRGGRVLRIDLSTDGTELVPGPVRTIAFAGLPGARRTSSSGCPTARRRSWSRCVPTHRSRLGSSDRPCGCTTAARSATARSPRARPRPGPRSPRGRRRGAGQPRLRRQCAAGPVRRPHHARPAADLISVKIGINLVNVDLMRLRAFGPAVHGFLDTIREGHPTPRCSSSRRSTARSTRTPRPGRPGLQRRPGALHRDRRPGRGRGRQADSQVIRKHLAGSSPSAPSPTRNLTYLDGRELYGEADLEDLPLPDRLHPTRRRTG